MGDPRPYLWIIPVLPLAGSVVTAFLGPRLLRGQSHWPCIVTAIAACVLSVMAAFSIQPAGGSEQLWVRDYYTWFTAGSLYVNFTLRLDALTGIMLMFVTFISSLIAIYSAGYMRGDDGYARFFAEVALFIFSMTGLVLADNYILLYGFWEGVGLCSYLLIGFWFTKPSAAAAARKAFLVTRIGDLGFLIGIMLLWYHSNFHLDYDTVFGRENLALLRDRPGLLLTICLLLFCGAVGKSAQFPLHVWLPDAMEGPTPVSALIHAATMVTAGVYLIARSMPLFRESIDALLVVACVGCFTAFLTALIALTQHDLKRVLAYSTISQLGYMFLALGSGIDEHLWRVAVVAAIFHVFTHAFFKALLFLASGSVMHAMGNVIDMRRFGGLRRVLPITHWTFLVGALALAGFPGLSGFWSKDEILGVTLAASQAGSAYGNAYLILLVFGMVTAALTAFYTFRAYFLTFSGPERIAEEAGHHAHEAPPVMTGPLIILAVFAAAIGIIVEPFTHWFSSYLTPTAEHQPVAAHGVNYYVLAISGGLAIAGIAAAWWVYVRQPGLAGRLATRQKPLYELSLNKFFFDDIYDALIVRPATWFAWICRGFDWHLLDGLVDFLAQVPRIVGVVFRPIQNGLVQFYALAMIAGLVVFLMSLVYSLSG